ncbi:N-isopropylammelide isopropyl amidohydrolase [Peribacillus sp. Bi96]|uniref:amidohydrolase n=1 Tax=Peribacillus sp. Bi96 TaxID=2884273 RepID=UPI001D2BDDDF|nr:amidohydrolase [Peribacillus sp. Bi96]CAH0283614.1 N-isopropylammelide isopropyl amidohydrolase [Peribacillus sp. Bi96]
MYKSYWLTNVTLDSGYVFENERIDRTKTDLYNMYINDGVIKEIQLANVPLQTHLPVQDAGKLLALPAFKEMHNHLDKTYLGMPWKSCTPVANLMERLKLEAAELAELARTGQHRAEQMLQLLLKGGATHVRTHVNIDPYIGLKNLEEIQKALDRFNGKMTHEIVAFPQHGLLRTNSTALMRQAMREGASLVGGLDPGGVDNNIEASLYEMVNLAVEFDADIDIHIHDPGHLGFYTIKKLASFIDEAGWKNRVAVSHAFALGDVSIEESHELASLLSNLGMAIMSTVPINRIIPPIDLLHEKGVHVALGCDGFYDSWSPFGTGDMLEKSGRLAERYNWKDEYALSQSLQFITGGLKTLDRKGNRLWPNVGDDASVVLVDASCSAEAVARRSRRAAVIANGNLVYGGLAGETALN